MTCMATATCIAVACRWKSTPEWTHSTDSPADAGESVGRSVGPSKCFARIIPAMSPSINASSPPELLVGDILRLRRSTPADATSVFAATNDTAVTHFMEWSRHTELSTTESFFSGCVGRWESGTEFHWIIETSDHYDTAGCIALRIRGHAADFGYFLLPEFWGRGLASAAATLVITWLKHKPGIFHIWATTDSGR